MCKVTTVEKASDSLKSKVIKIEIDILTTHCFHQIPEQFIDLTLAKKNIDIVCSGIIK